MTQSFRYNVLYIYIYDLPLKKTVTEMNGEQTLKLKSFSNMTHNIHDTRVGLSEF